MWRAQWMLLSLLAALGSGCASMLERKGDVWLTVRETGGVDRRGWPVATGVPFPDGAVPREWIEAGHFRLLDAAGRAVPCQADVAATWGKYPQGSNGFVKWLHLYFLADVPADGTGRFLLQCRPEVADATATGLTVAETSESVVITTGAGKGALRLVVSKRRANVPDEAWLDVDGDGFGPDDRIVSSRAEPNLRVGYNDRAAPTNVPAPEVRVEKAGPVLAVVRVAAKLDDRFESVVRLFVHAGSRYVRIQETLIHGPTGQGPSAVRSQAVTMKSHVMEMPVAVRGAEAVATIGTGEALPEPAAFGAVSVPLTGARAAVLEQDLRHECRKDNVGEDGLSQAFSFAVFAGGPAIEGGAEDASARTPLHAGRRAPGWADLSDRRWGVTATVRNFWQTFPKRLVVTPEKLRLEHWAEGARFEPPGRDLNWMGMARTHDVGLYFHLGDAKAGGAERAARAHLAELRAVCEPEVYCASRAYALQPLTPAVQGGRRVHPDIDKLMSAGLNRERTIRDGFYFFREREDGYGYFNFGDFLVSGYWGCQEYDPAFCSLQQFYRTGEPKYLDFAAECARFAYDVLYSHTYTPDTSNYPQREHDKSGSHFRGEDSHGQRSMNIDPGHVFLLGLANYWYLTADPRAADVIAWSLPVYLGDDWYRITGGGTWRYLGGYLFTVFCTAYELTWDDRYVEPMLWAVRQYMVHNRTRHTDGIWWERTPDGGYTCQPWLADSVTNGYSQLLELYPGCPYRPEIERAVVNLADFLLDRGFTPDLDGLNAQLIKPSPDSGQYRPSGSVYRKGMGNMAVLTLARAYYLTGDEKYLPVVRKVLQRVTDHTGDLGSLKGVTQATYYAPMVLPYLEGAIPPRPKETTIPTVPPTVGWRKNWQSMTKECRLEGPTVYLGDELAAACAPPSMRGEAFGNHPGWRMTDVLAAVDGVLARARPRHVVVLVGGSDLATGHPERTDFEANYTQLLRRIRAAGALPIPVTLPPCSQLKPFAWQRNAVIVQAAVVNRLAVIDLDERMRDGPPSDPEPFGHKVPSARQASGNTFQPGHEAVVAAELEKILRAEQAAPAGGT